jgi:haloalkane dehalogenase
MGDSGKAPDGAYRFVDHARYLDAWFDALGLYKVTLVVHDWGSALGFHWACRNPTHTKALAYMEAIVQPLRWEDWNQQARPIFEALRGPAGEEIVLQENQFVERILPGSIIRKLTEPEMAAYRRPWLVPGEGRRPMLQWPREIPIDGEPQDVAEIVSNYSKWLSRSAIPKLFVNANPGAILIGAQREFCRTWANQHEVTVNGVHFVQEDSPHEIGAALADWYRSI